MPLHHSGTIFNMHSKECTSAWTAGIYCAKYKPSSIPRQYLIQQLWAVKQGLADGEACSISLVEIPNAMLYKISGVSKQYNGWGSAINQWLSGGSSYNYSQPGSNSLQTQPWSQVRLASICITRDQYIITVNA